MIIRYNQPTNNFVSILKKIPDLVIVTPQFITIWHPELETAIVIPGDFLNASDKTVELTLSIHLEKLNAKLIS